MALTVHPAPEPLLDQDSLDAWSKIPTAIISDELNRTSTMLAEIRPLADGMGFAAQALTVQCMVGDNSALHYALTVTWPGCALIVDGRAHVETALWGGILTAAAQVRQVRAIVVDGAVRDAAELRASELGVYTRAVVPNGPHKGFGGEVNGPIQCAGVRVDPGDLVVADDDGVVVVRPSQMPGLMERCRQRIDSEADKLKRIADGATTVELLGFPRPEDFPS